MTLTDQINKHEKQPFNPLLVVPGFVHPPYPGWGGEGREQHPMGCWPGDKDTQYTAGEWRACCIGYLTAIASTGEEETVLTFIFASEEDEGHDYWINNIGSTPELHEMWDLFIQTALEEWRNHTSFSPH